MTVKGKLITDENYKELSKWYPFGVENFKGWVGFHILLSHSKPTEYFEGMLKGEELDRMYEKVEELEDGWRVYKRKEDKDL